MEALNEKRISMNDILKTKLGNNIIQSDIFNGHEKILNTDYNSMLLGLGFTIDNTQEDETFIYKISDTQSRK